jgi:hypothetical protein
MGHATLGHLSPGTYEVVVEVHSGATVGRSDPEMLRVHSNTTVPTTMYRVSEYTYNVDFLTNHNSADLVGQVCRKYPILPLFW